MNKLSILALASLLGASLAAQPCTTLIAYGEDAREGRVTAPNEKPCYLLQGTTGDRLRVSYYSDFFAVVEVTNPDGSRLCFGNWNVIQANCTMTQTGTHRVRFYSDNLTRTGRYWFSVQRLNGPANAQPMCYDNRVSSSVDARAEVDAYTIPGSQSNVVRVSKVSSFFATAELLDPNGDRVCFVNWNQSEVDCTLPADGTYTLLVRSDNHQRTGTYTVGVECRTTPCECTAIQRNYGEGWPGSGARTPSITASGRPVLGTGIDIRISNSRAQDTFALLLLGFSKVETATVLDGMLLVGPPLSVNQIPVLPAAGMTINLQVPNQSFLCNVCAHLQVLEADPGASQGVSFTPGLTLILGR